jgi:hypothetical protein
MEFDDLVREQLPSSEHYFHPSLFDAVFDLTGRHVGTVDDFVKVAIVHDVRFFMMLEHITRRRISVLSSTRTYSCQK